MFGRSLAERGRRMDECLTVLLRAWTEEEFEYDGRTVRVTPKPSTAGGPFLFYGGGSPAAARRAARFGLGFFAQTWAEGLGDTYRDECVRLGKEPGLCVLPRRGSATTIFVAEDVDQAWQAIGPFMLHDARMYASWLDDAPAASKSTALTVDALRAEAGPYRVLTPEQAVEYARAHGALALHPLCGGCPPEPRVGDAPPPRRASAAGAAIARPSWSGHATGELEHEAQLLLEDAVGAAGQELPAKFLLEGRCLPTENRPIQERRRVREADE